MDEDEITQEENMEDDAETRAEINQEIANEYGAPKGEEKINQFKITSDAAGLAIAGDPRILNFRVLKIGWQQVMSEHFR